MNPFRSFRRVAEAAKEIPKLKEDVKWLRKSVKQLLVTTKAIEAAQTKPLREDPPMTREQFLLKGLDKATAVGVEIGPFFSPLAPKADGWKTTTVDFTDQEGLLNIARNHDQAAIREGQDKIEKVDIVWRDQPLHKECLALHPEGFDYLIVSHVLEHMPDIIGFFKEASLLAKPEFILSVAIPDARRCFDYFKPLTNVTNALRAHRMKLKMHSPETVFEANAYCTWKNGHGSWHARSGGVLDLPWAFESALDIYRDYVANSEAGTQSYVDAHAWHFTPSSFKLFILELNVLGLIDFKLDAIEETNESELWARLVKGKETLSGVDLKNRRLELLAETRKDLAAR